MSLPSLNKVITITITKSGTVDVDYFKWIEIITILQVGQFLTTNCSTSKLSADGSVQRALAIRAEQFQDRCMESDTSPIKPEELRSGVQAYGIGGYMNMLNVLCICNDSPSQNSARESPVKVFLFASKFVGYNDFASVLRVNDFQVQLHFALPDWNFFRFLTLKTP